MASAASASLRESADEVAVRLARDAVEQAFSDGGALSRAIPGFVARPSQRELAASVLDAIAERGTLVVEAGTGTGKTFAYLVPALLAGGKVLISTGTKALQDQVFGKDLSEVRRALGSQVEAAILKGRQNYVCLHSRTHRCAGDCPDLGCGHQHTRQLPGAGVPTAGRVLRDEGAPGCSGRRCRGGQSPSLPCRSGAA
jgi:hypothetical protein